MPSDGKLRIEFLKDGFVRSMRGAERVHILYSQVVFGPASQIGKGVRVVLTDAELLALSDRITRELSECRINPFGGTNGPNLDSEVQAVPGVHPPDSV